MTVAEIQTQGPLAGVRIVEIATLGPVSFCCMLFADMGAEILTIGAPEVTRNATPESRIDQSEDPTFRGRTRLTLNLKDPSVRDLALAAISKADIVVEGFRPGVMERLGLGPEV